MKTYIASLLLVAAIAAPVLAKPTAASTESNCNQKWSQPASALIPERLQVLIEEGELAAENVKGRETMVVITSFLVQLKEVLSAIATYAAMFNCEQMVEDTSSQKHKARMNTCQSDQFTRFVWLQVSTLLDTHQ